MRFVRRVLVPLVAGVTLHGACAESVEPEYLGAIQIHLFLAAATSPDLDGFLVSVDNGERRAIDSVAVFDGLEPGAHTVRIEDIAPQCTVAENPRMVTVSVGVTSQVVFDVRCVGGYHQQLSFDKLGLVLVVGETARIRVTALTDEGDPDEFSVTASASNVVSVTMAGDDAIAVTGLALGRESLTVTTGSGASRSLPVAVYDEMVLPVNEGALLLKYADAFEPRGAIGGPSSINVSSQNPDDLAFWGYTQFYHPVTADGWYALGSLGIGPFVMRQTGLNDNWTPPSRNKNYAPDPDSIAGNQWMILVKDGSGDALAAPVDFTMEYKGCGFYYDEGGTRVVDCSAFWTPVCPAGYVALGTVVTAAQPINLATQTRTQITAVKPDVDDVRCVRSDLTAQGEPAIGYEAYAFYAFGVDPLGIAPPSANPLNRNGTVNWSVYHDNLELADDEVPLYGDGTYWADPSDPGVGAFRAWRVTSASPDVFSDRAHLETGTFVGIGMDGTSCSDGVSYLGTATEPRGHFDYRFMNGNSNDGYPDVLWERKQDPDGCWNPAIAEGRARVLAVTLPLALDAEEWAPPRLNGYEPMQIPEPAQAKVVRVPFSAALGGEDVYRLTPELLATSPFLRLEKVITYKPVAYMYCGSDLDCIPPAGLTITVEDVFSREDRVERTRKWGVSVEIERGIEFSFKAFNASAKVTVGFNYESSFTRGWSQTQLNSTTITAAAPCPANHACAAWTGRTFLVLHRRLADGSLVRISATELAFDLGAPIYFDAYP